MAIARHGHNPLTPASGAQEILEESAKLDFVVNAIADRAMEHWDFDEEAGRELRSVVKQRARYLIEQWYKIAQRYNDTGTRLQYQAEDSGPKPLLYDFLNTDLATMPLIHQYFRANRSMRDVEPEVDLIVKKLSGAEVEG